jgi:threonine synthase
MRGFAASGRISLPGTDPCFQAGMADTESTLAVMRRYFEDFNYLLDPHTAVGVAAAEAQPCSEVPTVCLATAHPAKFRETVQRALQRDVARHPALEGITELPRRCTVLPAAREAVQDFIRSALPQL